MVQSLFESLVFFFLLVIFVEAKQSQYYYNVNNYAEPSQKDTYELQVLPEYELERYVFPTNNSLIKESIDSGLDDSETTVLYRMPSGPKSPESPGKPPVLIQQGVLCDSDDSCEMNKPLLAIAYILVDQGYDIWFGISNSTMIKNFDLNENKLNETVDEIARYIFLSTGMNELYVLGNSNGTMRFFAISSPTPKQTTLSKWIDMIPGVKFIENLYRKGKNYISKSIDKMEKRVNNIKKKLYHVIDDPTLRNLKHQVLKAWGIIEDTVGSTLETHDFSKMINHPDVYLDTIELIRKYGYGGELHEIQTEDGYLLKVHRISGGEKYPPKEGKPVIYLQHGFLTSSADWIIMGPEQSLGYLLADQGYDVWLGNSRGNTYSKTHVSPNISRSDYWNFSWHEMGVYDLPATIDYILNTTGNEKLTYIGHSQGSTTFFVLLSERPEYNDKIEEMFAYAPITFCKNLRSPIVRIFYPFAKGIFEMTNFMDIHQFLPSNSLLTTLGRDMCEGRALFQVMCTNIVFLVTGYDTPQINETMFPVILGHMPAGASLKQLLHYAQLVKSGKFRPFEYSYKGFKKILYGHSEPPDYNLNNVRVPVNIFYSGNDYLSDIEDVKKLAKNLPNIKLMYKVPLPNFNHVDYHYGINAPELVYQKTIDCLANFTVR